MKVNGKKLDGPRIVKLYLPIANDEAVEFQFRPLRSDEDFEKVLERPQPKAKVKPGGEVLRDTNDPEFKRQINAWATKKLDWEFLVSISATKDLEWETVKTDDPETWKNWRDELEKTFGVSATDKVFNAFLDAQYITEESMERARARFLTGTPETQAA